MKYRLCLPRRHDMSKARRDSMGRPLRKGESERKKEHRYSYAYTDDLGQRRYVYNTDLNQLREMEKKIQRDLEDGIGCYGSGNESLNDTFDRYLDNKYNLRGSTKTNYIYMYDHYVRPDFGKRRVKNIKYSDVLHYYIHLMDEDGLKISTVDSIHCLLHPTFEMAVRDQVIRMNPTNGVMSELYNKTGEHGGIRHALTPDEQKAFMKYTEHHPVYYHWWPMFAILLGTGCRIGEVVGLRWEDVDLDKREISINHTITYYATGESKSAVMHVHQPKTEAGIRIIPMFSVVHEAFDILKDDCEENGYNEEEIDGMSGFVFKNRFGNVPNPGSVNRTIKRIVSDYNAEESLKAVREQRDPLLLPNFSCHSLRHTFITRLCERETNLKVIQSIGGHADIRTTMERYAEATERRNRESIDSMDGDMSELLR